ncbi:MAG: ABC transporter ATP-binding protein [Gemmatimonadota bacterium]
MIRRFLSLLSRHERIALWRLTALMTIAGALEAIGPLLLALYLRPPAIVVEALPPWLAAVIAPPADGSRSAIFPIVIGVFYACKIAYVIALSMATNRFAFTLQADLASRVLRSYLEMPFVRFRDVGKGAVVRDVISEPSQFTFNVTIPVLQLVSETLVLSALACAALLISWQATITLTGILGVTGALTYLLTRNIFRRLAEQRRGAEERRAQALENATGGWLEIRFARAAAAIVEGFRGAALDGALRESRQQVLSQVPRQMFEVALLLAVIGILFMQPWSSPEDAAKVAVALAAVGFRFLPSVTRIGSALQLLRYGAPTLEHTATLIEELTIRPAADNPQPQAVRCITLDRVSFRHRPDADPVLEHLSHTFARGELTAIVAPSGRGKTTLMHVMVGLLEPYEGVVAFDGEPVQQVLATGRVEIGYLGQHPAIIDASFWDNLRLGRNVAMPADEVAALCEQLRLPAIGAALRRGEDPHLGSRGFHLSGGEKQRVALVRALARKPAILLLDEPTSGLDPESERVMLEVLRERRATFVGVLVTHSSAVRAYCDRVIDL